MFLTAERHDLFVFHLLKSHITNWIVLRFVPPVVKIIKSSEEAIIDNVFVWIHGGLPIALRIPEERIIRNHLTFSCDPINILIFFPVYSQPKCTVVWLLCQKFQLFWGSIDVREKFSTKWCKWIWNNLISEEHRNDQEEKKSKNWRDV